MTRRYLTRRERLDMFLAQKGRCAICGCRIHECVADHSTPGWFVNHVDKPNQLICIPCNTAKTSGDVSAIAKTKRILKRAAGDEKPKRKIQSRGFDRTLRRKFNGSVERRT